MSDILARLLWRAVESYASQEHEKALELLLEAWREARIERFAELAE